MTGITSSSRGRETGVVSTIPESIRVPAGHVFAMGDNRDDSLDSRVLSEVGFCSDEEPRRKGRISLFSPMTPRQACGKSGSGRRQSGGQDFLRPLTDPGKTAEANKAIERLLKYQFADRGLLEEALTHKSWGGASYERLEFLGDRVLDLIVAGMLFERYPDQGEGTLAAKISVLVSRETLAKVARKLGLPDYLRTDSRQGSLTRQDSVVADCCEAVIGAIYLDGGLESARDFVVALWAPLLETEPAIAKTELQGMASGQRVPPS